MQMGLTPETPNDLIKKTIFLLDALSAKAPSMSVVLQPRPASVQITWHWEFIFELDTQLWI